MIAEWQLCQRKWILSCPLGQKLLKGDGVMAVRRQGGGCWSPTASATANINYDATQICTDVYCCTFLDRWNKCIFKKQWHQQLLHFKISIICIISFLYYLSLFPSLNLHSVCVRHSLGPKPDCSWEVKKDKDETPTHYLDAVTPEITCPLAGCLTLRPHVTSCPKAPARPAPMIQHVTGLSGTHSHGPLMPHDIQMKKHDIFLSDSRCEVWMSGATLMG